MPRNKRNNCYLHTAVLVCLAIPGFFAGLIAEAILNENKFAAQLVLFGDKLMRGGWDPDVDHVRELLSVSKEGPSFSQKVIPRPTFDACVELFKSAACGDPFAFVCFIATQCCLENYVLLCEGSANQPSDDVVKPTRRSILVHVDHNLTKPAACEALLLLACSVQKGNHYTTVLHSSNETKLDKYDSWLSEQ